MGTVEVVFDTNVLVSALIWGGKPERCLALAVGDTDVQMFHSGDTLAELDRVLNYPKFEPYLTMEDVLEFRATLLAVSERIDPDIDLEVVDDPDDDIFIELAIASDAKYVVSGDDDLLGLGEYDGARIVSPDEFLTEMAEWRRR